MHIFNTSPADIWKLAAQQKQLRVDVLIFLQQL